MYKITFIQVGKTKDAYGVQAMAEFEKRLQRYVELEVITIPEGKFLVDSMIQREKKEESIRIRQALSERKGTVFYLDVQGRPYSSEEFAGTLQNFVYEGIPLIFIIGGAYGIDEDVLGESIRFRISLSKMTFTHQMVRLIFLEQLYRAFSIISGAHYHH